jgi:hypothetical protein
MLFAGVGFWSFVLVLVMWGTFVAKPTIVVPSQQQNTPAPVQQAPPVQVNPLDELLADVGLPLHPAAGTILLDRANCTSTDCGLDWATSVAVFEAIAGSGATGGSWCDLQFVVWPDGSADVAWSEQGPEMTPVFDCGTAQDDDRGSVILRGDARFPTATTANPENGEDDR